MADLPSVAVITATTGHPNLGNCIRSVQAQTYAHVEHLVVIDGPEWYARADAVVNAMSDTPRLKVMRLPHPTGKNQWNGHRIYGAAPSLMLTDLVCWLDEDNWLDADHLASLVQVMTEANVPWAFSLRKIVDKDRNFICLDECESLGNLHPTIMSDSDYHIDTSCYLLRRELAIRSSWVWNRVARPPAGELPGPDKLLCHLLMQKFPQG